MSFAQGLGSFGAETHLSCWLNMSSRTYAFYFLEFSFDRDLTPHTGIPNGQKKGDLKSARLCVHRPRLSAPSDSGPRRSGRRQRRLQRAGQELRRLPVLAEAVLVRGPSRQPVAPAVRSP